MVLSVNPDLTPAQLKNILKSTTDPVVDENNYYGMVGSGRVNAYKAVRYAYNNCPLMIENTTFSITKSFIRNQISISDVTFDTNAAIFIKTGDLTIDNGEFEIKNGSTLHIVNYTCQ